MKLFREILRAFTIFFIGILVNFSCSRILDNNIENIILFVAAIILMLYIIISEVFILNLKDKINDLRDIIANKGEN